MNDNSLIFNVNGVDRLLNTQIDQCINSITGAKLMSPDDLSTSNSHNDLIHVTFNSALFGFIDDLYMITNLYTSPSDSSNSVTLNRQLSI